MTYYAMYRFSLLPARGCGVYVLEEQKGIVEGLTLPVFQENEKNKKYEIAGKQYIRLSPAIDRNIKRYFPLVFETTKGKTLSGVEMMNDKGRTFGDTKKLGNNDLILIQFNNELKELKMFFIKNRGLSRDIKKMSFDAWNCGEELKEETYGY